MTPRWHEGDAITDYVAGTMPSGDVDAFEEHLLSCAACSEAVRLGAALRVAGKTQPARARRLRERVWLVVPALAAAVLVAVMLPRAGGGLGDVTPPEFIGMAVRGSGDSTATAVDDGMAAYAAGRWSDAARLLAKAAAQDSTPGVAFYLGVSRLMAGDDPGAVSALLRASAPRGNPYSDDAIRFAAKGLVRLGQRDSALAIIRGAGARGELGAVLSAFRDSLVR